MSKLILKSSFITFISLFLIKPSFANGNEVFELDLKSSINRFLNYNYDVKISTYEIEKAKKDIITASFLQNPDISLNLSSLNFSPYKDKDNPDQTSIRINQPFELVGKRENKIKIAETTLNVSQLNYQDNLRVLIGNLITTYYQVMFDNIQLEAAKENIKSFEKILKISEIKFQKGFLPELEYTKLEIQKLDFEKDITNSRLSLKADLETLKYLLAIQTKSEIKIKDEVIENISIENSLPKFIEKALEKRNDLKVAQKNLELSDLNITLNKYNSIPDMNLNFGTDVSGPSFKSGIGGGIGISLPIFNKNEGEIQKAEENKKQAELNYEKTKYLIISQVKQNFYTLIEKENIFKANQAYLSKLKKLKENEEKAYILGGISSLDLIAVQKTFKDYQKSYNLSFVDLISAKQQLKLIIGDLI